MHNENTHPDNIVNERLFNEACETCGLEPSTQLYTLWSIGLGTKRPVLSAAASSAANGVGSVLGTANKARKNVVKGAKNVVNGAKNLVSKFPYRITRA